MNRHGVFLEELATPLRIFFVICTKMFDDFKLGLVENAPPKIHLRYSLPNIVSDRCILAVANAVMEIVDEFSAAEAQRVEPVFVLAGAQMTSREVANSQKKC